MKYLFYLILCITAVATPPEKYQALKSESPEKTSFSFNYRGALCVVTPLNKLKPFMPKEFTVDTAGKQTTIKPSNVLKLPNSCVQIFKSSKVPATFDFNADFTLKNQERVVAISPDGLKDAGILQYSAAIGEDYHSSNGPIILTVVTDKEDEAARLPAGCPVFRERDGALIGVVRYKYSPMSYSTYHHANNYSFETLSLPGVKNPKPALAIKSLAGIPFKKTVSDDCFRWIFPKLVFTHQGDWSDTKLPYNQYGVSDEYNKGKAYLYDDRPLFQSLSSSKSSGELAKTLTFHGEIPSDFYQYPKFNRALTSLLKSLGKPKRFAAHFKTPNKAYGSLFVVQWQIGKKFVTLAVKRGMNMMVTLYIHPEKSSIVTYRLRDIKLSSAPRDVVSAYQKWLREALVPECPLHNYDQWLKQQK